MESKRLNDDEFFKLLLDGDAAQRNRSKGDFPWDQRTFGEDRFAAEEKVREVYASLKLNPPKVAWATSPAAMWSAVTMLKQFAMKQRLVDSLVPAGGGVETESKRALLSAIIDSDLTVSMGAPVARLFGWKRWECPPRVHRAIREADRIITHASRASAALARSPGTAAGYSDAVLYPVLHAEGIGSLAANAFCILPYARICWFCLPPLYVKTNPEGHLHSEDGPAIAWADGYSLECVYVEPKALPAPEEEFGKPNPNNPTLKLLNGAIDGLKRKTLEGKVGE